MRKFNFLLILLCVACSSPEESGDVAEPEEKSDLKDVIREMPPFVIADFHTFNLVFFGCERVESNRNWEALNDSVYLTVTQMPDSIEIFETRGIEKFILMRQNEVSMRVKGADGQHLDLVDWKHDYTSVDTMVLDGFKFRKSKPDPVASFSYEFQSDELDNGIREVEQVIGSQNWSTTRSSGYDTQAFYSRTFYEVKAWFNNGDSTRKMIILHYAS